MADLVEAAREHEEDVARRRSQYSPLCAGIFCVSTILIVATLAFGYNHYAEDDLPEDRFMAPSKKIEKPLNDERTYQYETLSNGLRVLNVHDRTAGKVAIAAAVHAGSFDDFEDFPGLSDLCRHMLFKGSEKYRTSGGFDEFVRKHDGVVNSSTTYEVTTVWGEVTEDGKDELYMRMADMMRAPLFAPAEVSQAAGDIEEHLTQTMLRLQHDPTWVMKSLANPDSPVVGVSSASLRTLADSAEGPELATALKKFFAEHYCPSRMSLVTFGSEDLSEQLGAVTKYFGDLPPGSAHCEKLWRGYHGAKPWRKEDMAKWVSLEGAGTRGELLLMFPLPDASIHYHSNPLAYIKYQLEYDGPNSLTAKLKEVNAAYSVNVTVDTSSAGTHVFLGVPLTDTADNKESAARVLDVIFYYLAMMKARGADTKLYNTLRESNDLKWNLAPTHGPVDTVRSLADAYETRPAHDVLKDDEYIERMNVHVTDKFLDYFSPENMNVALVSPLSQGVSYTVMSLSDMAPGSMPKWQSWLDGSLPTHDNVLKGILAPPPISKDTIEKEAEEVVEKAEGGAVADPEAIIDAVKDLVEKPQENEERDDTVPAELPEAITVLLTGGVQKTQ